MKKNILNNKIKMTACFLIVILGCLFSFQHSYADASVTENSSTNILAKIVGGSRAVQNDYPWMTALSIEVQPNEFLLCGGTLIDAQWVLTAAHCMFYPDSDITASDIRVVVNEYDQASNSDDISQDISREVSEIFIHPGYSDSEFTDDIALLKLNQPITVDIAPITLAGNINVQEDVNQNGSFVRVMGWGVLDTTPDAPSSAILQQADVPYISNDICRNAYSDIRSSQVCAGFYVTGGVDSCQGDSGGPLIFQVDGNWVQLGVVSFGNSCAQPENPGVYTNVSQYINWIQSIIPINRSSISARVTTLNTSTVVLVAGNGGASPAIAKPASPSSSSSSSASKGGGGGGSISLAWLMVLFLLFIGQAYTSKHKLAGEI